MSVDETRKLIEVTEIYTVFRFRGTWRGRTFECRALPTTSWLSVGQKVICHVVPGSTELIAINRKVETGYLPVMVIIWSGSADALPTGWNLCDGTHYAPDLRGLFVFGAPPDLVGQYETWIEGVETESSHVHEIGDEIESSSDGSAHAHSYPEGVTSDATAAVNFIKEGALGAQFTHNHHYSAGSTDVSGAHTHPRAAAGSESDAFELENSIPPYYAKAYICNDPIWVDVPGQLYGGHYEAAPVTQVPIGGVLTWNGVIADIPSGWHLCNGDAGTIDLRDRMVVCIGANVRNPAITYTDGETGGAAARDVTHTHDNGEIAFADVSGVNGHAHTGLEPTIQSDGATIYDGSGSDFTVDTGGSHTHGIASATQHTPGGAYDGGHSHDVAIVEEELEADALPPCYALAFIQRVA
jgi:hypothetical protein